MTAPEPARCAETGERGSRSLRAAGWTMTGVTEGGEWGRPSRSRRVVAPTVPKKRWEVTFGAAA